MKRTCIPLTALAFATTLAPSSLAQQSSTPTVLYGVLPDGQLKWYGHNASIRGGGLESVSSWASGSMNTIGIGWSEFQQIFSGGEGVVYGVLPSGELKWYRNTGYRTGAGYNDPGGWDPKSGTTIGSGWNSFKQIFSTGKGVIYGVLPSGELKWYRNAGYLTGAGYSDPGGWDRQSGKTIGIGWSEFEQIFSGGSGVIYGVLPNGELKWYRNTGYMVAAGEGDPGGWDARSGKTIGIGWGELEHLTATRNGVIYGVGTDGDLKWYRNTGYLTGAGEGDAGGWDAQSGKTVGVGWGGFQNLFGF